MKQPVKCECGKRIADRDEEYIYIFCKGCKRIHRFKIRGGLNDEKNTNCICKGI